MAKIVIVSTGEIAAAPWGRLDPEYYIEHEPTIPKLTPKEIEQYKRLSADALKLRQLVSVLEEVSRLNYTKKIPPLMKQIANIQRRIGRDSR